MTYWKKSISVSHAILWIQEMLAHLKIGWCRLQDAGRGVQGTWRGLCLHLGSFPALLILFLFPWTLLYFVFQTTTILSLQSPNCRQRYIQPAHQNFLFSWIKLFLSSPALKHFAWKLNVFGQNFSFSPFSSDLWRKVVFTAEHLLNGQSRLHFCNTLTAARTLPHFDKIIKNTCFLQNIFFATQSHWPEYFPILTKSSWFFRTRIKTKKENDTLGN